MSVNTKKPYSCPKCGSEMKKGFFYVRNADNPLLFSYVVWIEGEKENIVDYMGSQNAPQYPLTPFKCSGCGFIEHFADEVEKWRP